MTAANQAALSAAADVMIERVGFTHAQSCEQPLCVSSLRRLDSLDHRVPRSLQILSRDDEGDVCTARCASQHVLFDRDAHRRIGDAVDPLPQHIGVHMPFTRHCRAHAGASNKSRRNCAFARCSRVFTVA